MEYYLFIYLFSSEWKILNKLCFHNKDKLLNGLSVMYSVRPTAQIGVSEF